MKTDRRIERLYENLTAKETAVLVYSHLSRGNVAEADRISALVPLKVYRLPDPEHVDNFEGLRRVTLFYAMERWRYQAHCYAASWVVLKCYYDANSHDAEDKIPGQEYFEAWGTWETRLLSIDAALEAVCIKHGVDLADVRRMAGADGLYQVLGLGVVDPQLVAEMTRSFDDVLQGK